MSSSKPIDLLRFSTAGSVDDGKSTFVGRLLYDTGNVYDDHLASLEQASSKVSYGGGSLALALLTDGLKAEREQGITIDVAYRYFSTENRRFILADTPGHEQYTRNMATGASTANLTIVIVDAARGISPQTKRHAFIAALLGVPRLLVAINKMDLVGFSKERFDALREEFSQFASKLGVRHIQFVPVSALQGDNVAKRSEQMSWYQGETVLEYLENVFIGSDANLVDLRIPVQGVIRADPNYRGYSTRVASGRIRVGEEVLALPSMRSSKVKSIDRLGSNGKLESLETAVPGQSVTIVLQDEIDLARGDLLVRPNNVPHVQSNIESMLVWLDDAPMRTNAQYRLLHSGRQTKVTVTESLYNVDISTLSRVDGAPLACNQIGRVRLQSSAPLFFDSYEKNRATGHFILVDVQSCSTVAAGMFLDRKPSEVKSVDAEGKVSREIHHERGAVDRAMREESLGGPAKTLWFTGLSGSGKSTAAKALERSMFEAKRAVYRLDGDNLRFGINRDLGFSAEDRTENVRRAAEIAKLFNDAGVSVICALISPFEKDRALAKEIIGEQHFCEVYFQTPLEVCEKRDPHGLYKKARSGVIKEFTGISSPYEAPQAPTIIINTAELDLEQAVDRLMKIVE